MFVAAPASRSAGMARAEPKSAELERAVQVEGNAGGDLSADQVKTSATVTTSAGRIEKPIVEGGLPVAAGGVRWYLDSTAVVAPAPGGLALAGAF